MDADHGRGAEGALQLTVVALRSVQVPGAIAGVVRRGGETCVTGQWSAEANPATEASSSGQELRAGDVADPGQAGNNPGVWGGSGGCRPPPGRYRRAGGQARARSGRVGPSATRRSPHRQPRFVAEWPHGWRRRPTVLNHGRHASPANGPTVLPGHWERTRPRLGDYLVDLADQLQAVSWSYGRRTAPHRGLMNSRPVAGGGPAPHGGRD